MSTRLRTPGVVQGVMLLLPITMNVVGVAALAPVVPLLLEQFKNAPYHEYLVLGGILTMPSLWVFLFSPFAGWIADRFGRRKLLIVAMVVYALIGMAPVVLDDLYLIIASRAGVGICEAVVLTVTTTIIGDYFTGRTRERWLAGQTALASVSALGIIYVGGLLGSSLGWRGPFYLYGYSLPLALLVAAFIWEPLRTDTVKDDSQREMAMVPVARTTGICAISIFASISFYLVITKNAEALTLLGVADPAKIGQYTVLATIGVPIGSFLFWGLAKIGLPWLLLIDFGLLGFGFYYMGHAATPASYVFGCLINQIGCGLVLPTLVIWALQGVSYSVRGRVTGFWQGSFAVGQFLSGMVVTLTAARVGGLLQSMVVIGELLMVWAVISAVGGFVFKAGQVPGEHDRG